MTLILTELSEAGIAMAADSAITYRDQQGRLNQKAPTNWLKLLKVPSIKAAVSYWGVIGLVSVRRRFDHWLQNLIKNRTYHDLSTLADCIASELNQACGDRPLSENNCVGVHVAGYAPWSDDVCRPVFFHVHNGHGHFIINKTVEERNGQYKTKLTPEFQAEPRKLFAKHQDFPDLKCSLDKNLDNLRRGYITRNGDYLKFSIIAEQLSRTFDCLNLISGFSIPRDPSNLQSRLGYLLIMLDITISIYSCSTTQKTIGRPVVGLGIRPDGSYVDGPYSKAIRLLKSQ